MVQPYDDGVSVRFLTERKCGRAIAHADTAFEHYAGNAGNKRPLAKSCGEAFATSLDYFAREGQGSENPACVLAEIGCHHSSEQVIMLRAADKG